jgi:2',3'-cyclic-nucleotide 2'-phosphodiesterase (5'-nucleotidase family)
MPASQITGDNTLMRDVSVLNHVFRSAIIFVFLFVATSPLVAQSTVIEPCPAAPAAKPTAAPSSTMTKVDAKASQIQIDSSIPEDPELQKLLSPYTEKVRALSAVIGTLEGSLSKTGVGAGSLGHFVTDAILAEARRRSSKNIVMAIMNAGGLRKNEIAAGPLRASDLWELMPFENSLITLDLTGEQLKQIAHIGTRDAQAGAQIEFRYDDQNRTEVISAKLRDASGAVHGIDPKATYTIVTIDYLYKLNSGPYAVLQEAKNVTELHLTVRNAVTDYIKAKTAAGRRIQSRTDDRFVQIGPGPVKQGSAPND